MKISELIEILEYEKSRYGDLDIILSEDEEGNSYSEAWAFGSGYWNSFDQEFHFKENFESDGIEEEVNAICLI